MRVRTLRGLGDDPTASPVDTGTFDPTAYAGTTNDFTPPTNIDTSGFNFGTVPALPPSPNNTGYGDFASYFSGPADPSAGATSTGSASSGGNFDWGSFFGNISQTALAYYKTKLSAQPAQAQLPTLPPAGTPRPVYPVGTPQRLQIPAFTNPATGQTNWGAVAAVGGGALLLIALLKR